MVLEVEWWPRAILRLGLKDRLFDPLVRQILLEAPVKKDGWCRQWLAFGFELLSGGWGELHAEAGVGETAESLDRQLIWLGQDGFPFGKVKASSLKDGCLVRIADLQLICSCHK